MWEMLKLVKLTFLLRLVVRECDKPILTRLVFRQGGSDTIGHDMHHTSSSRQFEVTNGFFLAGGHKFLIVSASC